MSSSNNCPDCSSDQTFILESRKIRHGARRRRHACRDCEYRWTVFIDSQGEQLDDRPPLCSPRKYTKPSLRKLSRRDVHQILTARLPISTLALELGVSRETIRQVRIGRIYTQMHPELPRQGQMCRVGISQVVDGPTCLRCLFWRDGECGMGFPDPIEEGPAFAADCSLYEPVSQSISLA
jgi:transposase-like protein